MVTDNHYRWDFIGLSTDSKPTPATSEKVVDGSTFYCSDTSKLYVFCKDTWYERLPLGSGGGGGSYIAGNGIDITDDTISVDTEVIATMEELNARINKGEGTPTTATEGTVGSLYEDTTNGKLYICTAVTAGVDPDPDTYTWEEVGGTTYTAGSNITISNGVISATDTTYSNFVGTDGTSAGTAGLVPAPATTDAGKFLKADGTWDTAGGSSVTVVQTIGSSTTDVMSQNAVCSSLYNDPTTGYKVQIGNGANASGNNAVAIGGSATATPNNATAVGYAASANNTYATALGRDAKAQANQTTAIGYSSRCTTIFGTALGVSADSQSNAGVALGYYSAVTGSAGIALGAYSSATRKGEINVGVPQSPGSGFNSTDYRLISGLHDGQGIHDAATVAQGNTLSTSAPTTSTVGVLGQLYTDTTNLHTYQCTAIDTTDPSNPSYTWTQRW